MLSQFSAPDRCVLPAGISPSPDQLTPHTMPDKNDYRNLLAQLKSGKYSTPWFDQYRWQCYRLVGTSSHEVFIFREQEDFFLKISLALTRVQSFEHPVLVVMVTTAHDPDPLGTFQTLFQTHKQSLPYMHDHLGKVYLIMHDMSTKEPVQYALLAIPDPHC